MRARFFYNQNIYFSIDAVSHVSQLLDASPGLSFPKESCIVWAKRLATFLISMGLGRDVVARFEGGRCAD